MPPGLILGLLAASPPVLSAPKAALEHATEADSPLQEAEIELLAGDPVRARATLGRFSPANANEETRKMRLELDAAMDAGDVRTASDRIDALFLRPGWKTHARRQAMRLKLLSYREDGERFGSFLFALSTSILMLGAARELLRIRKETIIFGCATIAAMVFTHRLPPPFPNAIGIVALATLALVHGASGAIVRVRPSPKGRLFLLTTLVLGSIGAFVGVSSKIDPSSLGALFG